MGGPSPAGPGLLSMAPRGVGRSETSEAVTTTRVRIRGRVQGVWYRGWTVDQARALGLDGWVRNRCDGSVEAVFSGPDASVRQMIERCWSGPPAARVGDIVETAERGPAEAGFHQRPTI